MKKQLHLCEMCLKDYEAKECVYDTNFVDKELMEKEILKQENEQLKEVLGHYKAMFEGGTR